MVVPLLRRRCTYVASFGMSSPTRCYSTRLDCRFVENVNIVYDGELEDIYLIQCIIIEMMIILL